MKANELRVSNILKQGVVMEIHSSDAIMSVDGLMASNKMPLEILEPIPLTPEILEQCGFVRVDNKFYHNWQLRDSDGSYSVQERDDTYFFSNDYSDAGCYVLTDIKYLHELQNIYWCLAHKELTVNASLYIPL
jgi:hypothetical protein